MQCRPCGCIIEATHVYRWSFVVDNATPADLTNGIVPIRNEYYRGALRRVRLGIKEIFEAVQYKATYLEPVDWRPREYNTAADYIAN